MDEICGFVHNGEVCNATKGHEGFHRKYEKVDVPSENGEITTKFYVTEWEDIPPNQ